MAKDTKRVLEAVQNGDIGLIAASRKYSVSKATLKRHLDGKNYFAVENTQVIGSVEMFPTRGSETSESLEQHTFDVSVNYLRCLAFQITELNHFSQIQ